MIQADNEKTREKAAKIVATGGVIAFRTDTFYGLGANPLNIIALRRIREIKGREDGKPILVLLSDTDRVVHFIASQTETFQEVASTYWPGPLTLIGKARPGLPEELTSGTNTIGVRLPDDTDARAIVRSCGGALTATSANISGREAARTAAEVESYFPSLVDLIIDGGEVTVSLPSTVLDLSGPEPRLLREGAVSRSLLSKWL